MSGPGAGPRARPAPGGQAAGPRVAVLDYQAGNVRSAQRGLRAAGADAFVTADPDEAAGAGALVVPGVGHFATCLRELRSAGLQALLERWITAQRPVLGICVGLQLLYEHSAEGDTPGLGILPGRVRRLPDDAVVPHIGWDVVEPAPGRGDDPLLEGVVGRRCYFVHSYYADPADAGHVVAVCRYGGVDMPCVARVGSVVGTQFHPEKSGAVGARFLDNWVADL